MEPKDDPLLATRRTLLAKMRNLSDQESWQQFFDTYAHLIFGIAIKAGLTASEAQEALQETMIAVAKKIGKFEYDPGKGKFKGWLLRLARWRIYDQFRKRAPGAGKAPPPAGETTRTATIARVPDPRGYDLEDVWNREWSENLFRAAIEAVRKSVDAGQFRIFEMNYINERPAEEVAKTLSVPIDAVYRAKHRILVLLKKEVARLQSELL